MKKTKLSADAKIGIGAGIGAALAAAAAAYYFYGTKEGAKKRRKIEHWTLKAKKEVLEKIRKMEKTNKKTYRDIINGVLRRYQEIKNIDPKEIAALAKELTAHWNNIKAQIEKGGKKQPKAKTKKRRRA